MNLGGARGGKWNKSGAIHSLRRLAVIARKWLVLLLAIYSKCFPPDREMIFLRSFFLSFPPPGSTPKFSSGSRQRDQAWTMSGSKSEMVRLRPFCIGCCPKSSRINDSDGDAVASQDYCFSRPPAPPWSSSMMCCTGFHRWRWRWRGGFPRLLRRRRGDDDCQGKYSEKVEGWNNGAGTHSTETGREEAGGDEAQDQE